jgi:hypothetical protein
MKLELDLITLAYIYLQKKKRITHKEYTIVDLLFVCEEILRWNEQKNRFIKNNKIKFLDEELDINDKIMI